jgi:hypothetical protein
MKHIHADLIHAWANGAEIEVRRSKNAPWDRCETPRWYSDFEYRIKQEPVPDVVAHYYATICSVSLASRFDRVPNLKLTFDGAAGKLKSAEVL